MGIDARNDPFGATLMRIADARILRRTVMSPNSLSRMIGMVYPIDLLRKKVLRIVFIGDVSSDVGDFSDASFFKTVRA